MNDRKEALKEPLPMMALYLGHQVQVWSWRHKESGIHTHRMLVKPIEFQELHNAPFTDSGF